MINRLAKLSHSNSFFIFGPRGAGKSTLLRQRYSKQSLYIDLLDPVVEDRYRVQPNSLKQIVVSQASLKWVIIDEVQKLPRLLDVVHHLIENTKLKFILSGSSARKLKRGGANLLAGRAFVFHLYPFLSFELNQTDSSTVSFETGDTPEVCPTSNKNLKHEISNKTSIGKLFYLEQALQWGLLPKLTQLKKENDKKEYLRSYALTYLKEEIQMEQIVRKIFPFRKFLEVAAQMNAKIINYSKIARDIGVDTTTVQNYYSILEDTLIGFYLPPWHTSLRKSQRSAPKFYLFDTGVCRALKGTLDISLLPQTYDFGEAFEHFIILECMKLKEYYRKDWRFFYLRTKDGVEVDLIIERPGLKKIAVEIKSTPFVKEEDVKSLNRIGKDMGSSYLYCLSRDSQKKKIGQVSCLPWQAGLKEIFQFQP